LVIVGCSRGTVGGLPSAGDLNAGGLALDAARRSGSSFGRQPTRDNANFSVIHRFNGSDGQWPSADLIDVKGTLYGTTWDNVFKIASSGKESSVYNLSTESQAGLLDLNGMLYGTTYSGGTADDGTVFQLTPFGHESVLHSFTDTPDGQGPEADLIDVDGTLYGTTDAGGATGNGTVFKITPSGSESIVYSFKGQPDGSEPRAGLVDVNGTLWGTTAFGGDGKCTGGCGTVFKIAPSGAESVYSFQGAGPGRNRTDGQWPLGSLVDVKGTLYGTTALGGDGGLFCGGGCGTVFSITQSGFESVLHSFHGLDGYSPEAGLIDVNGTLYGTTFGGSVGDGGTVFKITTSGEESLVHGFRANGPDGAIPVARLLYIAGVLYGTTREGGIDGICNNGGCGTVFKISL
jgi:uncharacterized repeat protein (TIGR03803 family)